MNRRGLWEDNPERGRLRRVYKAQRTRTQTRHESFDEHASHRPLMHIKAFNQTLYRHLLAPSLPDERVLCSPSRYLRSQVALDGGQIIL